MKLYQDGLINTNRKISLKILNNAVKDAQSDSDRMKVEKLKRIYVPFVFLLYLTIIIGVFLVFAN